MAPASIGSPRRTYAVGPRWSPDGTHLAFMGIKQIVSSDGLTVDQELNDIYTIRPNGQEIVQLTDEACRSRRSTCPPAR